MSKKLETPRHPPIPPARVGDPSLQRVYDAVKETIETFRGTRGDVRDRAVFVRDLINAGIISFDGTGVYAGPAFGGGAGAGDDAAGSSIPPLLENIVASAGFSYVLLTWNDPQYRYLSHYEIWRREVADPSDEPSYTADDARITSGEQAALAVLIDKPSKTPAEVWQLDALTLLQTRTTEYDYAKNAAIQFPNDQNIQDALTAAATALRDARLGYEAALDNDSGQAVHVGSSLSPVFSDPVNKGRKYLYWVRAISTNDVPGPFNVNGVLAITAPDISGIIDELTDEANRDILAQLIYYGLERPDSPGHFLLDSLNDLEALATQAISDASDALGAVVSGIPPSIWQSIRDLYNALASTVLGLITKSYETTLELGALRDRVITTESTLIEVQSDTQTAIGRIDTMTAQYDGQFASVNGALLAMANADSAMALDIDVIEGAVYDPDTGLQAAHARVDAVMNLTVTADTALAQKFDLLVASVGAVEGQLADILTLQIAPDAALASKLTDIDLSLGTLTGSIDDLLALTMTPGSALAQKLTQLDLSLGVVAGQVRDVMNLRIDENSLLAESLRQLQGEISAAAGQVSDLMTLNIDPDSVLARRFTQIEGSVEATQGSVSDLLELRISPDSALGHKITDIEASVDEVSGQVRDILSLNITDDNVLAGKLTQLTADTTYGNGLVQDLLSLRLTNTEVGQSALAGTLTRLDLSLADMDSRIETITFNELQLLKDADGNVLDPIARAGWTLRIEQTVDGQNYIAGFGLTQDIQDGTANSVFMVQADKFVVIDPDNPNTTTNAPFIIANDPDTGEKRVFIRSTMIDRAWIQELTAQNITADFVAVGAVLKASHIDTPEINMGVWTKVGDTWVLSQPGVRQGNFSVNSAGFMEATGAKLQGLLITKPNGDVVMDAGIGYYGAEIANSAISLQLSGTTFYLTGAGAGQTISLPALGYSGAFDATKNVIQYGTSFTGAPNAGDIWVDTSTTPSVVKVRYNGNWVAAANNLTASTQLTDSANIQNANVTLPSLGYTGDYNATRNRVWYQAGDPGGASINGDIWIDTDATPAARVYVRVSGAWQLSATNVLNSQGLTDRDIVLNANVGIAGSNGTITLTGAGGGSVGGVIMPGYQILANNIATYLAQKAIGGVYIADLGVNTLQIGANAVTVPQFAETTADQAIASGGAYTTLLTLSNFYITPTGLGAIDNAIPVVVQWFTEANAVNNNQTTLRYRVQKNAVNIAITHSGSPNTDTYAGGAAQTTIAAGVYNTFTLQATSANGLDVVKRCSMQVMAVRR